MNPSRIPSALLFSMASLTLLASPGTGSQTVEGEGGGTLQVGSAAFKFRFESINLAPAQPNLKLPRTFVLRGKLEPESGPALTFELTAMEDGRIYGLRILRKRPKPATDDYWGATLKTKVEVLELDARPGGKLRLSLSGPLTSVEENKMGPSSWKGALWATFREVPF